MTDEEVAIVKEKATTCLELAEKRLEKAVMMTEIKFLRNLIAELKSVTEAQYGND